jgi:hypothetical protein
MAQSLVEDLAAGREPDGDTVEAVSAGSRYPTDH